MNDIGIDHIKQFLGSSFMDKKILLKTTKDGQSNSLIINYDKNNIAKYFFYLILVLLMFVTFFFHFWEMMETLYFLFSNNK